MKIKSEYSIYDNRHPDYVKQPFASANLPKKDAGTKCNGRIRTSREGYCKKPAGWGTYHNGTGRCRVHGGNNKSTHGLFAQHNMPSLKEAIASAAKDPKTYLIDTQLALQQGSLNEFISWLENSADGELTDENRSMLLALSDLVSKTLERKARIESTQQHTMRIEALEPILNGVIETIRRFVPDEKTREAIAQALVVIPMPAGVSFGIPSTNFDAGMAKRVLASKAESVEDVEVVES